MKVILLTGVAKIGKKDEIKEVNSGYAQNFLFPRKLAIPATDSAIKSLQTKLANKEAENKIQDSLFEELVISLKDKEFIVKRKANEKGHLFSKVDKPEIIETLNKETHASIDESMIILDEPIKQTGDYKIKIKHKDKKVEVNIKIESE